MVGHRTAGREARLERLPRRAALRTLWQEGVLARGVYQGLGFAHQRGVREVLAKVPVGLRRARACRAGLARADVWQLTLGQDRERNWNDPAPAARLSVAAAHSARRLTGLVRGLMLRTEAGPLRAVWALAYRCLIRIVSAYLRRGHPVAGVYVARSFAVGDAVYGVSDVDLAVVVDDEGSQTRIRARWERLCRRLPLLGRTFEVYVHERDALAEAIGSSIITFDLDPADTRPARGGFLDPTLGGPEWWVHRRPGLFEPLADWKLVAGPDRRPRAAPYDAQERRIAAWLELVVWWSYAVFACRDLPGHRGAYQSAKFVTEVARIWLWLAGETNRWEPRERVLAAAARLLPEEEAAFRRALELRRHRGSDAGDPLAELLPTFARLTGRIGRHLGAEVESAGHTAVRLTGASDDLTVSVLARDALRPLAGGEPTLLPLADWQGLAWPELQLPDESFVVLPLDAGTPDVLAAAAEVGANAPYVALPLDGALVVPSKHWGSLRTIQCAATDPATFAVAQGKDAAEFPDVVGWSAKDTARRAVAEHRTWLESVHIDRDGLPEWMHPIREQPLTPIRTLGRLFTAARASLFRSSIDAGEPELALTIVSIAAGLGESTAAEASESYRSCRPEGADPAPRTIAAFYELVASPARLRIVLPRDRTSLGSSAAGSSPCHASTDSRTTAATDARMSSTNSTTVEPTKTTSRRPASPLRAATRTSRPVRPR